MKEVQRICIYALDCFHAYIVYLCVAIRCRSLSSIVYKYFMDMRNILRKKENHFPSYILKDIHTSLLYVKHSEMLQENGDTSFHE